MWNLIGPLLQKILEKDVTEYEMAFGLDGIEKSIQLRNWISFKLRETIQKFSGIAHFEKGSSYEIRCMKTFKSAVKREIFYNYHLSIKNDNLDSFKRKFGVNEVFFTLGEDNHIQYLYT